MTLRYAELFSGASTIESANNLAPLRTPLNIVSGDAQINLIAAINGQDGAAGIEVTLVFTGACTVKHGQTAAGNFKSIRLAGGLDYVSAANSSLRLVYDGTQWQEVSRNKNYVVTNALGAVMDKTSGTGIQVDLSAPTFGWRDLEGPIRIRTTGPTAPAMATYIGGLSQVQFSVNDEEHVEFHMPHDWVPGSDLFIHAHWSHNATTVTGGTVTWGFEASYSKGHNRGAFITPVTTSVQGTASTTRYQHIISEVQLSASSPSASQINTGVLEVDGLILVRVYLSANNITVSGGGVPEPFLHFVDIHYQSSNLGTKQRAPDFYT
jgi:hypothetical protein